MAGQLMLINPRKRRGARKKAATKRGKRRAAKNMSAPVKHYYPNPVRGRKRRGLRSYKRNPIGGMAGTIFETMKEGAIGAAGAVAAKIVANFLPIPETFKSGRLAPLVQALIGAGTGLLVGKFISRKIGTQVGVGAVTVALYSSIHGALAGKIPGLSGSDYEIFPEQTDMNEYDVGAYDMAGNEDAEDETDIL